MGCSDGLYLHLTLPAGWIKRATAAPGSQQGLEVLLSVFLSLIYRVCSQQHLALSMQIFVRLHTACWCMVLRSVFSQSQSLVSANKSVKWHSRVVSLYYCMFPPECPLLHELASVVQVHPGQWKCCHLVCDRVGESGIMPGIDYFWGTSKHTGDILMTVLQ